MEAALLGIFMISACLFVVLLDLPVLAGSPGGSRRRTCAGS